MINIVLNVALGSVQTVQIYTFITSSGDKVVFGFDRGLGGTSSKWKMTIDDNMNISVKDDSEEKVAGYLMGKDYIQQNQTIFEGEGAEKIVADQKGKKVKYSIYRYNSQYLCAGYFDKTDDVGYLLWTADGNIEQEEAERLFARFRGTYGAGYWFSKIFSELIDLLGDD